MRRKTRSSWEGLYSEDTIAVRKSTSTTRTKDTTNDTETTQKNISIEKHKNTPNITQKNMEFTKNRSPSRGRCAIAPRPFPCGSSVLTEVATASMVTVSNMPVRCLNCKSTGLVDGEEGGGGKLRSCGKCKTACYCGRECQVRGYRQQGGCC